MRVLLLLLLLIALGVAIAPWALWAPRIRVFSWKARWRLACSFPSTAGAVFFRRGKSGIFWCTTLSSTTAPTVVQIVAGVRMDKAIVDISGFETQLNRIATPIWDTNQDIQSDGPQQLGDAQMVLLDDDGVGSDTASVARQAVKAAMVEQATGFMVVCPTVKTPIVSSKVIVFPAKIGAVNTGLTLDVQTARYTAQFAITDTIVKDAVAA